MSPKSKPKKAKLPSQFGKNQTKTSEQILNDYWNLHPDTTHKQYREALTKKWVPLEIAEKRIVFLMGEDERLFTLSYAKLIDLETRLIEANKILDHAELVSGGYIIQGENWLALRDILKEPNGMLEFLAIQKAHFNSEIK